MPESENELSDQWLNLEVGCATSLMRLHGVSFNMAEGRRRSLITEAAHAFFPENGFHGLPYIAADEIRSGLTGTWRERFAACGPPLDDECPPVNEATEAQWEAWAGEMLETLSPGQGPNHAIAVHDAVHLSRLVRGLVPPIVAAECIVWTTVYRFNDPNPEMFHTIANASEAWRREPRDRKHLEREILDCAISMVGSHPDDPTLIPI